ncbi:superoxide dismutase [Bacteroidia bacterium]|nr:superoxide dismutase [Bacteroidia bacterium]
MFSLDQFPLNFAHDALAPFISEQTIDFHYGKHFDAYIKNLNSLILGTKYDNMSLIEIVQNSDGKIFNNAAQAFNHDFFFKCLTPKPTKMPDQVAGSFADFNKEFSDAAMSVFGSGWAWLVKDGDKLKIETSANADTPIAHGKKTLLTLDVWEHAYYLDYQNRRVEFVNAFLIHLVNWDFVSENLG